MSKILVPRQCNGNTIFPFIVTVVFQHIKNLDLFLFRCEKKDELEFCFNSLSDISRRKETWYTK